MNVRVCLTTATASVGTVILVLLFFSYDQPHVTLIEKLDFLNTQHEVKYSQVKMKVDGC